MLLACMMHVSSARAAPFNPASLFVLPLTRLCSAPAGCNAGRLARTALYFADLPPGKQASGRI